MNRGQDWASLAGETEAGLHKQGLASTPAEVVLVTSGTCHLWVLQSSLHGRGRGQCPLITSSSSLCSWECETRVVSNLPPPLSSFYKCGLLLSGHFLKEKLYDTKELWACFSISLSMSW